MNRNLRDEQVNLIVEASYSSEEWSHEIQMMDRGYNRISEWYNSENMLMGLAYFRHFCSAN